MYMFYIDLNLKQVFSVQTVLFVGLVLK